MIAERVNDLNQVVAAPKLRYLRIRIPLHHVANESCARPSKTTVVKYGAPRSVRSLYVFIKLRRLLRRPAVHLAMMEEEFVRRRRWLTHTDFLDRLATANLIPGPVSTEVAIFIGQLKQGWPGLIVAGTCFIVPAASIVLVIAWAYVRFGSLPKVEGILAAIKPAVVAIVIQALGKMARTGVRTLPLALIAATAAGLSLFGVSPIWVLVVSGLLSAATVTNKNRLLSFALPAFSNNLRSSATIYSRRRSPVS